MTITNEPSALELRGSVETQRLLRELWLSPTNLEALRALREHLLDERRVSSLLRVLDWWAGRIDDDMVAARGLYSSAESLRKRAAPRDVVFGLYERTLERDPLHESALQRAWSLAIASASADRLIAPLQRRAECLAVRGGSPVAQGRAWARLAEVRADHAGDVDGAIDALHRAVQATPSDIPVLRRLAALYEERASRGHGSSARADRVSAAELHHALARLDPSCALAHLDRALDAWPGHLKALRQLEQLVPDAIREQRLLMRWEAFLLASPAGDESDVRRVWVARALEAMGRFAEGIEVLAPIGATGGDEVQGTLQRLRAQLAGVSSPTRIVHQHPRAPEASIVTLLDELEEEASTEVSAEPWRSDAVVLDDAVPAVPDALAGVAGELAPEASGSRIRVLAEAKREVLPARKPRRRRKHALVDLCARLEGMITGALGGSVEDEAREPRDHDGACDEAVLASNEGPGEGAGLADPDDFADRPTNVMPRRDARVTRPMGAVRVRGDEPTELAGARKRRGPVAFRIETLDVEGRTGTIPLTTAPYAPAPLTTALASGDGPAHASRACPADGVEPALFEVDEDDVVIAPSAPPARRFFGELADLDEAGVSARRRARGRRAGLAVDVLRVRGGAPVGFERILPGRWGRAVDGTPLRVAKRGDRLLLAVEVPVPGEVRRSGIRDELPTRGTWMPLREGDLATVDVEGTEIQVRVHRVTPAPDALGGETPPRRLAGALGVAMALHLIGMGVFVALGTWGGVSLAVEDRSREEIFAEARLAPEPPPEVPRPVEERPRPRPRREPTPPSEVRTSVPRVVQRHLQRARASSGDASSRLASALTAAPASTGTTSLASVVTNIDAVRGDARSAALSVHGALANLGDHGVNLASRAARDIATVGSASATRDLERVRASGGSTRGRVQGVQALASVQGSLSRGEVVEVINRHIGRIQRCYEQALSSEPELSGRVSFAWTVQPNGSTAGVRQAGGSLGSGRVTNCIAGVIRGMSFPRPRGGPVAVTFPFVFQRAP